MVPARLKTANMTSKAQTGLAVGVSVVAHLLLGGVATAILALHAASPPPNDRFVDATVLPVEAQLQAQGDNFYATRESGEPPHARIALGGSVWWKWTALQEKVVEVLVSTPDFDAGVALYRGAVLSTLVEIAYQVSGPEKPLRFFAEPNTDYYIAVGGMDSSDRGRIELSIRAEDSEADLVTDEEELVVLSPEMFVLETAKPEPTSKLAFKHTDRIAAGDSAPDRARFESDKNTQAASDSPASADAPEDAPSIDGEDLPFGELAESAFIDGEFDESTALPVAAEWKDAEVEAAKSAARQHASAFEEAATDPDSARTASMKLAEAKEGDSPDRDPPQPATARPEIQPEPTDKKSESSFQITSPKRRREGALAEAGPAAEDVAKTPAGIYWSKLDQAIQRSWHRERLERGIKETYGTLKVRFWLDRTARVVDLQVLEADCSDEMREFSLASIKRAMIPEVPAELLQQSTDGRLEYDYEIILY